MSAELISCYQPKRTAYFSTVCQRRSQGGSIYLLVDIAVATAVSSYIFIARCTDGWPTRYTTLPTAIQL